MSRTFIQTQLPRLNTSLGRLHKLSNQVMFSSQIWIFWNFLNHHRRSWDIFNVKFFTVLAFNFRLHQLTKTKMANNRCFFPEKNNFERLDFNLVRCVDQNLTISGANKSGFLAQTCRKNLGNSWCLLLFPSAFPRFAWIKNNYFGLDPWLILIRLG